VRGVDHNQVVDIALAVDVLAGVRVLDLDETVANDLAAVEFAVK